MCLVIASPSGKRISDEILEDAARGNRDGAGIAWLEEGQIHYRKGLTVEELKTVLDEHAVGNPWVAHFRIATIGGVKPELTHPFVIDEHASIGLEGVADAVLFQNGTFGNWKDFLLQASASSKVRVPEPPWSDTRAVAFLCHVYGKHILSLLDNHSRFLILDAKEPITRRIMLWGTWEDHDGFKFSNRNSCAFHTHSRAAAAGGGQTHPTTTEAASESGSATDTAKATDDQMLDAMAEQAAMRADEASHMRTSSPGSVVAEGHAYRLRRLHNVWKHFTNDGLYVKADNERAQPGTGE